MDNAPLKDLGDHIAQLRYRQQLKQSELARDAGISVRTLQRLEAGDIVKTDVLLHVLQCLGRLDACLAALTPAALSPYEQLAQAGLTSADLGKRTGASALRQAFQAGARGQWTHKRRVRRPASKRGGQNRSASTPQQAPTFQWPEDQAS